MNKESNYQKLNQSLKGYQIKLIEYLKANNPEKLKLNPEVIEIKNKRLFFKMERHYGRLIINLDILDDFHTKKMKKVYARLFLDSQLMTKLLEDDE